MALDLPKPPSAFCSQDCFKAAWPTHKAAHRPTADDWAFVTDRGAGRVFAMPAFAWTGALRPAKVSPRRAVPPSIPRPDYAEAGIPASELASRQQKSAAVRSPAELAGIRAACRVAREILDTAAAAVRPGVTTDEIDAIVHEATLAAGAYPSPLNYFNFPKSVCTSVNEVVCHGIPDGRALVDGDIVNVDVTAFYKGYHGDLNETFTVGKGVDAASKKLIRVTAEALDKAIAAVKPGVRFRDIGDIITSHVRANECVLGWWAREREREAQPIHSPRIYSLLSSLLFKTHAASTSSAPIAVMASATCSTAPPTSRTTQATRPSAR